MATHDVQVVQHGDHGAALLVQAAEQRHELIGGMAVHGCKGLVQQQHRCVLHQHAREQRALHLAAGQGIQAAARLGGQAHGLQRLHAAVEFLATVAAPGADRRQAPIATSSSTVMGKLRSSSAACGSHARSARPAPAILRVPAIGATRP